MTSHRRAVPVVVVVGVATAWLGVACGDGSPPTATYDHLDADVEEITDALALTDRSPDRIEEARGRWGDCDDCVSTGLRGRAPAPPEEVESDAVAVLEDLGVEAPTSELTDPDDPQRSPDGVAIRSVTGTAHDVSYEIVLTPADDGTEVAVTAYVS